MSRAPRADGRDSGILYFLPYLPKLLVELMGPRSNGEFHVLLFTARGLVMVLGNGICVALAYFYTTMSYRSEFKMIASSAPTHGL